MVRLSKIDLIASAQTEADKCTALLEQAKIYQDLGGNEHIVIESERRQDEPNREHIEQLKVDRDWYLMQASMFHKRARKHLRASKRLARRAKWARV